MRQLIDFQTRRPGAAPTTVEVHGALAERRERTLALVEPVGEEDLERVHSKLMSPLVWDLARGPRLAALPYATHRRASTWPRSGS
jgi:hypothetical protein